MVNSQTEQRYEEMLKLFEEYCGIYPGECVSADSIPKFDKFTIVFDSSQPAPFVFDQAFVDKLTCFFCLGFF